MLKKPLKSSPFLQKHGKTIGLALVIVTVVMLTGVAIRSTGSTASKPTSTRLHYYIVCQIVDGNQLHTKGGVIDSDSPLTSLQDIRVAAAWVLTNTGDPGNLPANTAVISVNRL